MNIQAKRCTRKELAYLAHWRRNGYQLRVSDPIPLSACTPPSFATRRPVLDAFAAGCVLVVAVLVGCTWLAHRAGVLS